jgi:ABC-type hemin transport system substrate-binding protein
MRNFIVVMVLLFLGACQPDTEQSKEGDVRVISLSPGITHTIIDAGFSDLLVGRSPFCFLANQELPVVGDLRTIDYERLLRLSPTHVIVQATASGVDGHLLALSVQNNFELHAWPLDRVSDIKTVYGNITRMFGGKKLPLEIQVVKKENESVSSPVLVITQGTEGSAGLSFGRDTYIDDLLQEMGIENVVHQSGWVSLSLEDIGRLHPEAIYVVSDSKINDASLNALRSVGYRVIPFVHEHILVPSSYIVDVAKRFQEVSIEQ